MSSSLTSARDQAPRPLRIGFVSPMFVFGGIERWALSQFRLARPSISWAGLWIGSKASLDGPLLVEASRYVLIFSHHPELPGRDDIPSARRVCAATTAEALDRLAACCDVLVGWGAAPWAQLPEQFTGPVVLTNHGACRFTAQCAAESLSCGRITHTVAVSEAAADAFPPEQRKTTQVMPNGVELDRLSPTAPRGELVEVLCRLCRFPSGARIILYLGRIAPDKCVHLLPPAVAVVPNACLVLVGRVLEQRYADRVMALAAELLPGRHALLPEVEHVGDLLMAADCVVLNAPSEGASLVFLEALAVGCPCVTTDVGNVSEVTRLAGAQVAIRVPPQPTRDELADGIRQALAGGRLHPRVGAGRTVVWEHFSAAACAARWARYLCSLPARPKRLQVGPIPRGS